MAKQQSKKQKSFHEFLRTKHTNSYSLYCTRGGHQGHRYVPNFLSRGPIRSLWALSLNALHEFLRRMYIGIITNRNFVFSSQLCSFCSFRRPEYHNNKIVFLRIPTSGTNMCPKFCICDSVQHQSHTPTLV